EARLGQGFARRLGLQLDGGLRRDDAQVGLGDARDRGDVVAAQASSTRASQARAPLSKAKSGLRSIARMRSPARTARSPRRTSTPATASRSAGGRPRAPLRIAAPRS